MRHGEGYRRSTGHVRRPEIFTVDTGEAMAIAEISIVPIGTGDTSVSSYVAGALDVLRASGLVFRLTPMGTVIEGDLDDVLRVVRAMHETPFTAQAQRVYTVIKIDDRRDRQAGMDDKVASVNRKRSG
jgi:uncharacterized protein (TIGR00106 family)